MSRTGFWFLAAGLSAWVGPLVAGDWKNPPLYVASEKVELMVGRNLTLVSGEYTFEYLKSDDQQGLPWIYVHYPFYVEKGTRDWRELVRAANFEFMIDGHRLEPDSGSIVEADSISTYPVPDNAAVLFLTFKIPRNVAEPGFAATIAYAQSNFTYQGVPMTLHTPWLPRSMQHHPLYNLPDNVYELRLVADTGMKIARIDNFTDVKSESSTEIVTVPEHRKTLAVELWPSDRN